MSTLIRNEMRNFFTIAGYVYLSMHGNQASTDRFFPPKKRYISVNNTYTAVSCSLSMSLESSHLAPASTALHAMQMIKTSYHEDSLLSLNCTTRTLYSVGIPQQACISFFLIAFVRKWNTIVTWNNMSRRCTRRKYMAFNTIIFHFRIMSWALIFYYVLDFLLCLCCFKLLLMLTIADTSNDSFSIHT